MKLAQTIVSASRQASNKTSSNHEPPFGHRVSLRMAQSTEAYITVMRERDRDRWPHQSLSPLLTFPCHCPIRECTIDGFPITLNTDPLHCRVRGQTIGGEGGLFGQDVSKWRGNLGISLLFHTSRWAPLS